jgi:hypothetical protein
MNILFLGYFCSIALSLAGSFSPAPELVERAKGYATKQFESKIRYEDGVDRAEAFAFAEWQILGAIDGSRLPVQRYDRPKKDGDFWRINVFVKTAKGLKNRPILVDIITGDSNPDGLYDKDSWHNIGGGSVSLGSSKYRIKRGRVPNSFSVEVELNRLTEANDLAARQECYRGAVMAIAKIKQGFSAKFEDVPLKAIVISEGSVEDTYSNRNRHWVARFPLIQKKAVRPSKS